MNFIVDAHFPKKLADWFIENGDDAIHTLGLPNKNSTTDVEIIKIAEEESRIIVTKDSDFIQYRIVTGKPKRLLMVTTGNIVNKDLIKLFEQNFSTIKTLFDNGENVIEIDNNSIIVHK